MCTLPPTLVAIEAGTAELGSTAADILPIGLEYEQYYQQRGDRVTARKARRWPENELGDQPRLPAAFLISRYLITNAHYLLFIADGGYAHDAPWWDAAGLTWLDRDDALVESLPPWRRRATKQQPEFWHDPRFGAARANHPVVGVSLYEAQAFCRWLTQHPTYNPAQHRFQLPSELEMGICCPWPSAAQLPVGRCCARRRAGKFQRPAPGNNGGWLLQRWGHPRWCRRSGGQCLGMDAQPLPALPLRC